MSGSFQSISPSIPIFIPISPRNTVTHGDGDVGFSLPASAPAQTLSLAIRFFGKADAHIQSISTPGDCLAAPAISGDWVSSPVGTDTFSHLFQDVMSGPLQPVSSSLPICLSPPPQHRRPHRCRVCHVPRVSAPHKRHQTRAEDIPRQVDGYGTPSRYVADFNEAMPSGSIWSS